MINEAWRLAPWADALYACDERWWRLRGPSPAAFAGLRFIGKDTHPGCIPCGVKGGDNELLWCGRRLGAGANSGFQALNLAAVAGARRIVLLGMDMHRTGGKSHWHGDHTGEMTNPSDRMLRGCQQIMDRVAPELAARGIEVLNATRITALRAYRRVSLQEALA